MSAEVYMLLMLKHLSARGSLFLFVRTHHHLEYYFNLSDTRRAANQSTPAPSALSGPAKVIELRPPPKAAHVVEMQGRL
ncbi:MAG TPA: hypothetical protein VGI90_02080 [Steroidobacteraceae bacterium]